jgi:hypothetical protein
MGVASLAACRAIASPCSGTATLPNVIPIDVEGKVDVLVVPDANLAVSFDQCVIEYLDAPSS